MTNNEVQHAGIHLCHGIKLDVMEAFLDQSEGLCHGCKLDAREALVDQSEGIPNF
jgi:hypothetical protein